MYDSNITSQKTNKAPLKYFVVITEEKILSWYFDKNFYIDGYIYKGLPMPSVIF
jgi:hypothetical protein